jgi:hypothetical protein
LTSPGAGNACRVKASGEDDVCLVTNLPRYRCDHCIAKDPSARAQVGRTITTITTTARYKGQCNYCHDPIEIGDRIRRDLERRQLGPHRPRPKRLTSASRSSRPLSTARTRMLSYLPL